MCDYDEVIKMPINEPAEGKKKSQIQEFCDYYSGAGVQHIAMRTNDILHTVGVMQKRGLEFLTIPKAYYDNLREGLKHSSVEVIESLDAI